MPIVISEDKFSTEPTLDNFKKLENPTPEQFSQLLAKDSNGAATYLKDSYRNDFAQKFFEDASRIDGNLDLASRFFTEDTKANIKAAPQAANKYFSRITGKKFDFRDVSGGNDRLAFTVNFNIDIDLLEEN